MEGAAPRGRDGAHLSIFKPTDVMPRRPKVYHLNSENPRTLLPLGLLELDADGTVLYYNPEGTTPRELVGRNLFEEVAAARNREAFRQEVRRYGWSREPSRVVPFTFMFEDEEVAVTLLLARVREHTSGRDDRESIFVRITRAH